MLPEATYVRKGPWADMISEGRTVDGYYGIMPEFWLDITQNGFSGVQVFAADHSNLSSAARAAAPYSDWTATVYDVGVGNFDIALGNVWMNSERLQVRYAAWYASYTCVHANLERLHR